MVLISTVAFHRYIPKIELNVYIYLLFEIQSVFVRKKHNHSPDIAALAVCAVKPNSSRVQLVKPGSLYVSNPLRITHGEIAFIYYSQHQFWFIVYAIIVI